MYMILMISFILAVILYWLAEGVTEGYTWAGQKQRLFNKLIHPNAAHNGLMDYHAWRILENVGIWGAVMLAMLIGPSAFWPGIGAWFIGLFLYEASLNYVCSLTMYKETGWKWHILGYNIPWFTGKKIWAFVVIGITILIGTVI